MKEIGVILGVLVTFVIGSYTGWASQRDDMKTLLGLNVSQLKELKEACEGQLPRDKFCKITVDVKPE